MISFLFYSFVFTGLSGLGVTFLNSESLLAISFFIFLALCLHYSAPVSQSLQHASSMIHTTLLRCMIHSAKLNAVAKTEKLAKQIQLLASIKTLMKP